MLSPNSGFNLATNKNKVCVNAAHLFRSVLRRKTKKYELIDFAVSDSQYKHCFSLKIISLKKWKTFLTNLLYSNFSNSCI